MGRMKVIITAPQPDWALQFASEAVPITSALGQIGHTLHHIGSTAITGIWAKPIIDMLLEVDDLAALDEQSDATQRLRALGYEALGAFGIEGRRYFRKTRADQIRTHHLHAFARGSSGAQRHLAFRNYMNAHPDAAQAYSALKQQLATAHADDIDAYMDGKQSFVRRHEALALAWAASRASSIQN
jgi:GrpB-like predicted nucleotidyltransferase (UPF0157 family)